MSILRNVKRGKPAFVFIFLCAVFSSPMHAFGQDSAGYYITWFPPVTLTDSSYWAYNPRISLSGDDTVHITFSSYYPLKIPYLRSTNGGSSWEPIRDLASDTILVPMNIVGHAFFSQGSNLFLFSGGDAISANHLGGKLVMNRSTDCGATWSLARVGTDSLAGLYSAAGNGDTVMVVANTYRYGTVIDPPLLRYSTDKGTTWTMVDASCDDWTTIGYTPGRLHILRNTPYSMVEETWYLRTGDFGKTFDISDTLSPVDGYESLESNLAVQITQYDTTVFAIWRDASKEGADVGGAIFGRESHNCGRSFSPIIDLTADLPFGAAPAVALNKLGMSAVCWEFELMNGLYHVMTRFRPSPSSVWTQTYENTPQAIDAENPAVALSSNAIHLLWSEYFYTGAEHYQIRYQKGIISRGALHTPIHYDAGWNLASLPVIQPDTSTYQDNFYQLFDYESGYEMQSYMQTGSGYWVKFNDSASITFSSGKILLADTITVKRGWNIIGSLSVPIAPASITSIPPNLVTSEFFGYTGVYSVATIINPGQGYWVRMNEDGKLILSATISAGTSAQNRIHIVPTSDVPPPPPTGATVKPALPKAYQLQQNYPDPFNPTTTISYTIPKPGFVSLIVYDVLGREVARLVQENKLPGEYSVEWNAMRVSSGVYYYRLTAGNYVQTKKMLLMK